MRARDIVIVDADDVSRHGIATILKQADTALNVVDTFANLGQCEDCLEANETNILLLNDSLSSKPDILNRIEQLHQQRPSLAIIVISDDLNVEYIHAVFQHGASGFVLREQRFAQRIIQAVEAVAKAEWYLSPTASRLIYTGHMPTPLTRLSRRDIDVARLMRDGCTVQEIAIQLSISDQAIYRSRRKLREYLQVQTSEQIIAAAIDKGIITD